METGRKQSEGCWTCRVRRKRCNSTHSPCTNCQSLQITCHFGGQKPAWIDGAAEQKKAAQRIREEVKQNASRRRERRNLPSPDRDIVITTERDYRNGRAAGQGFKSSAKIGVGAVSKPFGEEGILAGSTSALSIESVTAGTHSIASTRPSRTIPSSAAGCDQSSNVIAIPNDPVSLPLRKSGATSRNPDRGVELGFVMIYLDYVFPFLFPFYRPPLLETGRHWLLSLLCQNEVSFHTAASLSSYFFSVVLQDGRQDMQDSCKALVWRNLMGQMDMAITKIQQDIEDINRHGVQATLMESAHVMGEIIQLLFVEVTVRRNANWTIHLIPALILFEDIFKYHGTLSSQPNLDLLLRQMHPPSVTPGMAHNKPLPNTADQSALLFFMAILLFIDVISSTALEQPPRLQHYHRHLLSSHPTAEYSVSLEAFVGCQNWVLLAISDISALNAWKKNTKRAGNLSTIDLVKRAEPICKALEKGLMGLDASTTSRHHPTVTAAGRLDGYYTRFEGRSSDQGSIETATRVWAHAANIYLSVVLSGWQPGCIDVQINVAKVLTLLQVVVESPAQLRSLAWPLCVAGCLALPSQEQEFRCVIGSMGELGVFGTIREAQDILEAVWRSRHTLDRNTWDIEACLSILGSPALLV